MSRTTVTCTEKHTPLAPHKNRIRRDWMKKVGPKKDLITISYGLLDVASALEWRGRIQVCDIDAGVRETTYYLGGHDGKKSDYPHLNIPRPGCDILSTVQDYYAHHGVRKLGAVDVDLAFQIKGSWVVLRPLLNELQNCGYRDRVFLTFLDGRDTFKSTEERIKWLKRRLLGRAHLVGFETYHSTRINDNASRSVGSHMCIVELRVGKNRPGRPRKVKRIT